MGKSYAELKTDEEEIYHGLGDFRTSMELADRHRCWCGYWGRDGKYGVCEGGESVLGGYREHWGDESGHMGGEA